MMQNLAFYRTIDKKSKVTESVEAESPVIMKGNTPTEHHYGRLISM